MSLPDLKHQFPDLYILVVDDCFVNQELTRDMLQLLNCKVDIAENGLEAVQMYQKNPYDLIFMDIQMPEKDGFSATRDIRSLEKEEKKIKIIAITGSDMGEDREKCLESGMDDYLSKPIHLELIQETLKKHFPEERT